MEETIKSKTHCPTCGSECKVGGEGSTHYYIPVVPEITDSEIEILAYKYADTLTNDSIQGIIIGENVLKAFTWLRSELERRKGM